MEHQRDGNRFKTFFVTLLLCFIAFVGPASEKVMSEQSVSRELFLAREALQEAGRIALSDQEGIGRATLIEIANLLVKVGDSSAAFEIADTIADESIRGHVMQGIVLALVEAGDGRRALETARSLKEEQRDMSLSSITYDLAQAGEFRLARQAATAIHDMRHRANALYDLAWSRVKAGENVEAAAALRDASDAAVALNDSAMIRNIAEDQAKIGNLSEAFTTVLSIRSHYMRASALTAIAVHQAKAGDQASASLTFQEAVEAALRVADEDYMAEALYEIAKAQVRVGSVEEALQTASLLEPGLRKGEGLTHIAVEHALLGNVEGALRATLLAEEEFVRARSLRVEAVRPGKHGAKGATGTRNYEVDERFARLVCLNHYECLTAYRASAQAYLKEGNVEAALGVAANIKSEEDRIRALREIAAKQVEVGDPPGAAGTLQNAVETAVSIEDHMEKVRWLSEIAIAQENADDHGGAQGTLQLAFELAEEVRGTDPRGFDRGDYFSEIITAQVVAGDITSALETSKAIRDDMHSYSWSLNEIAKVQAKSGEAEVALGWVRKVKAPLAKVRGLIGMARGVLERVEAAERKAAPE